MKKYNIRLISTDNISPGCSGTWRYECSLSVISTLLHVIGNLAGSASVKRSLVWPTYLRWNWQADTLSIICIGQSDYWKERNVGALWKEPYPKNKQLRLHMATDIAQFYSIEKNQRLYDNTMG